MWPCRLFAKSLVQQKNTVALTSASRSDLEVCLKALVNVLDNRRLAILTVEGVAKVGGADDIQVQGDAAILKNRLKGLCAGRPVFVAWGCGESVRKA